MVAIGVITAKREIPTLKASLKSLRACVDETIHVFAEPCEVCFDSNNVVVIQHRERLGAFRNYDFALRWLIDHTRDETLCVLEDDYIYSPDVGAKLKEIESSGEEYGYYNLFTNGYHPEIGSLLTNNGWNRIEYGFNQAWGVAYVFKRNVAKRLVADEFYQQKKETLNRVIDGTISECMMRFSLPMYYHNPSLVYSIGFSSTLGNTFKTDGYNFRGK